MTVLILVAAGEWRKALKYSQNVLIIPHMESDLILVNSNLHKTNYLLSGIF
jgi:hypothetical protein